MGGQPFILQQRKLKYERPASGFTAVGAVQRDQASMQASN